MTLVLRMKGKINNADAPQLIRHDPIESRTGSLFLWDAGLSPVNSANKATILPNLLNSYDSTHSNSFEITTYSATAPDPDYIRSELTAKGGIHFIVSQSAVTSKSINDGIYLQPTTDLAQKLLDKLLTGNANLYVSIWTKHTRKVIKSDGAAGLILWLANNTTNQVCLMTQAMPKVDGVSGNVENSVSKLNLDSRKDAIVNESNYYQFVIKKHANTAPSLAQRLKIGSGVVQPYSGSIGSNQAFNATPSYIVYRIYIEDLDLSGRTFEQVKAIDDAEHAKAFAEGGRFHGDTWSNPASVLP